MAPVSGTDQSQSLPLRHHFFELLFMCSENKLPNPGQSYKDERGTQVTIVSIEGG